MTMRVSQLFVLALAFILLVSSSWALERAVERSSNYNSGGNGGSPDTSPATGKVTVAAVPSKVDIVPVIVDLRKPLHDIQVSYMAAEVVRGEERKKYDEIRLNAASASMAEKKAVDAQLALQRRRVLMATLNSMTFIYQRARYVIEGTDSGLVALRSKYRASPPQHLITDFEGRMQNLEQQRQSLLTQSTLIQHQLESAPSSVELGSSLLSTKSSLSDLIRNTKAYLIQYTGLVQMVVSSS